MESKSSLNENLLWILVGVSVVIIGFIVIPPLLRKISNKAYKTGSKVTEQDFIDNQPEIVKKENDR